MGFMDNFDLFLKPKNKVRLVINYIVVAVIGLASGFISIHIVQEKMGLEYQLLKIGIMYCIIAVIIGVLVNLDIPDPILKNKR
jgi:hypothetical protein